ncbi:DUF4340 domain-containing protein [Arenimonas metalli]|uniref:DUF4340 domain-containing protein n=1 Tax=Arenimonas metalli CF5-1 TaxID=1384056 RepID=A0A091B9F1_9GAMM|nr:DUF4340 domain-containing protein [Arenimonas metalli]KFN48356.1 hypothetical protein N787_00045 [Arenimonas metalli CF5-1]
MRPRQLVLAAVVVAGLAGVAWWLLARQATGAVEEAGRLLPGFESRVEAIDAIEVIGAGGQPLVRIEKQDGTWVMPDRDRWPANQREVSRALFRLAGARRIEPKTRNPALHARLGVEDVAAPEAKGAELRLAGGGDPVRLVIGNNHPSLGGSYVRVGDDPQAWLLDEDIGPARAPADWLDRRLLDIPLARIEEVRIAPAGARAFRLSRVEDRFSLDGQPPAAMTDPDAGNGTAGVTDQLPFDDLAVDGGTEATQVVDFIGVDGVAVRIAAWRDERGTWARLSATFDEARALAWFEQADAAKAAQAAEDAKAADADADADRNDASAPEGSDGTASGDATTSPAERVAALRSRVDAWQASFEGRQFLLPPYKAAPLMRSRNDYLAGTR